ncbi:MAG: hypothetical protein QG653_451 [Patescibacteria group bacterium]|nr:hypothetical protein [Patescibacteria group bacterium]
MKPGIPEQRNFTTTGTTSLLEETLARGYRNEALGIATHHAMRCKQASERLLSEYQEELARVTRGPISLNP